MRMKAQDFTFKKASPAIFKILVIILLHPSIRLSAQEKGCAFSPADTSYTKGCIYRCDSIVFEYDKDVLRVSSRPFLDSISRWLLRESDLRIEIGVHGPGITEESYSRCLTCRRAKAISDYLIMKGIDPARLYPKGYSSAQPLIPEKEIQAMKTAAEKQKAYSTNRRIEFKIL